MFVKESCEDFVRVLGSKEPVPGGGGASALVGAIGIALGNMVASLTVGKKKYEAVEKQMQALKVKAEKLETELLELVEKDADAFKPLAKAYGLPKDTEKQKEEKEQILEEALKAACVVPLEIMKKCCEAIKLQQEFMSKGSALAISDAGVGVCFCKAALQGASLNVFINTKAMKDRTYAHEINEMAKSMLSEYTKLADNVFESVLKELK
jgi:formiminotetrahydrofolate cyclodeaminase